MLAVLFNASAPQGLGFLQASNGPKVMTVEDAEKIISQDQLDFDYLAGRPLKIDLSGDSFRPWGFDRDNGGEGAAQRIIDRLRASKEVNSIESQQTHEELLNKKAGQAMDIAGVPSSVDGNTFHLGVDEGLGDALRTSVIKELNR